MTLAPLLQLQQLRSLSLYGAMRLPKAVVVFLLAGLPQLQTFRLSYGQSVDAGDVTADFLSAFSRSLAPRQVKCKLLPADQLPPLW